MLNGWAALWLCVPNLLLCAVVLLLLRRQTQSHKNAIARLDALKRALDALDAEEQGREARPRHDPVASAATKGQSRLDTIEALLRRRRA